MSDTNIDIERGERYELDNYGEVLVMGLTRRIDAVNADGVVDDTILVKFNRNPQKNYITNLDTKKKSLADFLSLLSDQEESR